jgi:hypothetical protein
MAVTSKLNTQDIKFLQQLIADITNELCDCECCRKEKECSVFERVYIASNILYKKVTDDAFTISTSDASSLDFVYNGGSSSYTLHPINIFNDDSCVEWENIAQRITTNSSKKGKFVDKSRKKLLSRFYMYLYNALSTDIPAQSSSYAALGRDIFGSNADDVITNCLDECCNETV